MPILKSVEDISKGKHVFTRLLTWDRASTVFLNCVLRFKGGAFVFPNGSIIYCNVLRAQDYPIWRKKGGGQATLGKAVLSSSVFSNPIFLIMIS